MRVLIVKAVPDSDYDGDEADYFPEFHTVPMGRTLTVMKMSWV